MGLRVLALLVIVTEHVPSIEGVKQLVAVYPDSELLLRWDG